MGERPFNRVNVRRPWYLAVHANGYPQRGCPVKRMLSIEEGFLMLIDHRYKHAAITGKIIGCAMRVLAAPGNGFQERIYLRALEIDYSF